jgi:hypothetical protein
MVVTKPSSWSSFAESLTASGSVLPPDTAVDAAIESDTKLIRLQRLGILSGDRNSKVDWEEERSR